LVVPPRFLPFLPARLVFEAVADEADTFFQALECGGDWCQMLSQAASEQIRH
jgi:hypothetical protein